MIRKNAEPQPVSLCDVAAGGVGIDEWRASQIDLLVSALQDQSAALMTAAARLSDGHVIDTALECVTADITLIRSMIAELQAGAV